jgi:uncharacterized protein with GYD domain
MELSQSKSSLSGKRSFDLVAVLEAPNDETLAKVALAQAMLGVFRSTETMRAFTEEEFANIVAALP